MGAFFIINYVKFIRKIKENKPKESKILNFCEMVYLTFEFVKK